MNNEKEIGIYLACLVLAIFTTIYEMIPSPALAFTTETGWLMIFTLSLIYFIATNILYLVGKAILNKDEKSNNKDDKKDEKNN